MYGWATVRVIWFLIARKRTIGTSQIRFFIISNCRIILICINEWIVNVGMDKCQIVLKYRDAQLADYFDIREREIFVADTPS